MDVNILDSFIKPFESHWQTILSHLLTVIITAALSVKSTLGKILLDLWDDNRKNKQKIAIEKHNAVEQLLYNFPRMKAHNFELLVGKTSEYEQWFAMIAKHDVAMKEKISNYYYLVVKYAHAKIQFDKSGNIFDIGADGEFDQLGPDYLEFLHTRIFNDYDEVIGLLNKWK